MERESPDTVLQLREQETLKQLTELLRSYGKCYALLTLVLGLLVKLIVLMKIEIPLHFNLCPIHAIFFL